MNEDAASGGCYDWFHHRKQLFKKALDHRGSIYYTYQRNYFAAKYVGWLGWGLDLLTAVIGGVLIYVLRSGGSPQAAVYLAVTILISSLISSFYGPKLRSRDYYNAGQEHQELHDEFDHFIHSKISNPNRSNADLEEKLEYLNSKRHDLNQSTPQLGGIWYYLMKFVRKIKSIYQWIVPWKKQETWSKEKFEEIMPGDCSPESSPDWLKNDK